MTININQIMAQNQISKLMTVASIISLIISVIGYVFFCIALVKIAKKMKIKGLYLAFIPFAQFILLARIAGETKLMGKPVKHIGVYIMLLEIAVTLINVGTTILNSKFSEYTAGGGEITAGMSFLAMTLTMIQFMVLMANLFLKYAVFFRVYLKFSPRNALILSIFSLFNAVAPFLLFAVSFNKPQEIVERPRIIFMNNPYGQNNPNNNPYGQNNPYNNPYGQNNPNNNPYNNPYGQNNPNNNPYGQNYPPQYPNGDPYGKGSQQPVHPLKPEAQRPLGTPEDPFDNLGNFPVNDNQNQGNVNRNIDPFEEFSKPIDKNDKKDN